MLSSRMNYKVYINMPKNTVFDVLTQKYNASIIVFA